MLNRLIESILNQVLIETELILVGMDQNIRTCKLVTGMKEMIK